MVHVTAESAGPLATVAPKAAVSPIRTLAAGGEMETAIGFAVVEIINAALAVRVGSEMDFAVTSTCTSCGILAGAVYKAGSPLAVFAAESEPQSIPTGQPERLHDTP